MEALMDKKVLLTDLEKFELTEKRKNSERVKRDQRKEKKLETRKFLKNEGINPKKMERSP